MCITDAELTANREMPKDTRICRVRSEGTVALGEVGMGIQG